MPRVELDFTGADQGGAYPLVENGYYRLRLTKVGFARAGTGNRVIKTEWTIQGPRHRGGKLPHNFTIVPQSMWALRVMLLALGAKVPAQPGVYNTDQWLNREVVAAVGKGELPASQGRPKKTVSQITEWLSVADYEAMAVEARGNGQVQGQIAAPTEAVWDQGDDEDEFQEAAEGEETAASELPF